MTAAAIDFYFEFASPYGYLASTQIEALAARHGREVAWHPIMLGAAFKETGARPLMHTPLKGPYLRHDVPRFARLLGVPFREPPVMPANSLAASRAFVWLEVDDPGLAKQLAQAVFHAHWGEGRDIGAPEQVAEIAAPLGIEQSALLAAVAAASIKDRLKQATTAAIERGVFGSPFVFVDGEPFWGADRLPHVDAWLTRVGW
jgi:2-hydroxychromene-2-carboxylate isomerase